MTSLDAAALPALAADDEPAGTARQHPIARFLLRRIGAAVLTLWVLSLLVFLATSILPGDPAAALLGRRAPASELADLRAKLGLDRPLIVQYWHWFTGLLHGDLGYSAQGFLAGGKASVWSEISGKLANSAVLAIVAIVPIIVVSVLLGVYSALRAGRWQDHAIAASTLIPAALPEFVLGSVLIGVFFSWLDILPPLSQVAPGTSALAQPSLLVLPMLTLVGVTVGPAIRMLRAGMLEALDSDAVTVARLNGVGEARVIWRYAMRNAVAPTIQVFALIGQYLVGGLLVVEYLFNYPGVGKELVDAVTGRDNTEVQSLTMLLAVIYIAISITADLLVMLAVPKLRTGGAP